MGASRFARSGHQSNIESELVARLQSLPGKPGPDARFAAELRTQLVAITPRIVAVSAGDAKKSSHRHRNSARGFAAVRRPLLAVGGAAAVLVLLLGLAVHISGGALPGQSLYGLKRASEDFTLSVDGGSDTDRGMKYLKLASTRASESNQLVGSGPASPSNAALIASTLRTADSETKNGMQLLGSAALSTKSAAAIASIQDWASRQSASIRALLPELPVGSTARDQATNSIKLLQAVVDRVNVWKQDLTKGCLTETKSDDLGPLGC